jgi:hypothetical protein
MTRFSLPFIAALLFVINLCPATPCNAENGLTTGPSAVAGPFVNTFVGFDQQHFAYLAEVGVIWDSFYDNLTQNWNLQKINLCAATPCNGEYGLTTGPPAAAGPFVNTFVGFNQQHFAYPEGGVIWDSYYDDNTQSWNLQKINLCAATPCNGENGLTKGPSAVAGPFVDTFVGLDQQHFAYLAEGGVIWDSYYDDHRQNWNLQKLNRCAATPCNGENGLTKGPPVIVDPFANTFFVNTFAGFDQQHFAYLAEGGVIWDSYYDDHTQSWNLQKINLCAATPCNGENGLTKGPSAVAGTFVNTFVGFDQQHFAYLAEGGAIWDSYYDNHTRTWNLQKINLCAATPCNGENGLTRGPPAVAGPFVNTFVGFNQQHFAYLAEGGVIWDSYYDDHKQSWNLQKINLCAASRRSGNARAKSYAASLAFRSSPSIAVTIFPK